MVKVTGKIMFMMPLAAVNEVFRVKRTARTALKLRALLTLVSGFTRLAPTLATTLLGTLEFTVPRLLTVSMALRTR